MKKLFAALILVITGVTASAQMTPDRYRDSVYLQIGNQHTPGTITRYTFYKMYTYITDSVLGSFATTTAVGDSIHNVTLDRALANGDTTARTAIFLSGSLYAEIVPGGGHFYDGYSGSYTNVTGDGIDMQNGALYTELRPGAIYFTDTNQSPYTGGIRVGHLSAQTTDTIIDPGYIITPADTIGGGGHAAVFATASDLSALGAAQNLQSVTNNGDSTTRNIIRRRVVGAVTYQNIFSDTGINLQKGVVPEYGLNYSPVLGYSFLTLHGGTNDAYIVPLPGATSDKIDTVRTGGQRLTTADSSIFATPAYVAAHAGIGTVTSVTAGTGLSGGTITSTGTISMPSTGTPGSYGDASHIPTITTDAQGRVTSVTTNTFATGGVGTVTSVATDATLTGGTITSGGTLGLNLGTANLWTGAPTVLKAGIGTTVTAGLTLSNTTLSVAGPTFQDPPSIYFSGHGWQGSDRQIIHRIRAASTDANGGNTGTFLVDNSIDGGSTYQTLFSVSRQNQILVVGSTGNGSINASGIIYKTGAGGTGTLAVGGGFTGVGGLVTGWNNAVSFALGTTGVNNGASGNFANVCIPTSYSQNAVTSTASNTDLMIVRNGTTGTGTQRLFSAGTTFASYVEKFGIDPSGNVSHTGNDVFSAVGSAQVDNSSANGNSGTLTFASGVATVSNTTVTANTKVRLYLTAVSGTLGAGYVQTVTAGSGFTMTSVNSTGATNTADNSSYKYSIEN